MKIALFLFIIAMVFISAYSLKIEHEKYWKCPAMDDWIGNDDGRLVAYGKNFSQSCWNIHFGKQRPGAVRIGAICRTRNGG